MINLCKNTNLKAPEIKETGDSVLLTFYRVVPDSTGLLPDSTGLNNLSETEMKIFNLIHDKTTRREIQEKLSFSERTIRKILNTLQEKGFVEKLGKGPATYYKKNKT